MSKTVIITAGGTREYIDDIRVITNISTGALGAKIAEEFYREGYHVHYIHAKQSVMPRPEEGISESARLMTHQIVTCQDLFETMKALITSLKPDVVVHSAAVSDFTFCQSESVKLSSKDEEGFIEYLRRTITKTPKIIQSIKEWHPDTKLVGFKFTVGKDSQGMTDAVVPMFSYCDMVVANDKKEMALRREHIAYLYSLGEYHENPSLYFPSDKHGKPVGRIPMYGKNQIARKIVESVR